jgi:GTPase
MIRAARGTGPPRGEAPDLMTTPLDDAAPGLSLRPAVVAVVGRPNVGKSALFNRLIGKRLAIVDDTPGVTRDRLYALATWQNRTFSLVDTAGIDPLESGEEIAAQTRAQAELAAQQADVIVFVTDASTGLLPPDEEVAMIMRKTRRPVILAANKAESERARLQIPGEFARLGLGEPFAVSALHGEGTGDLLDAIVKRLPVQDEYAGIQGEVATALVGRPNVGKSSLLNALLGEERSIVSPLPGTTRDAIDTVFPYDGRRVRLIDTAGVRKRSTEHGSIEYYSSLRSLAAIARCDIAVLLIDSMHGITAQDRRLAGIILEERKGLIIVANKWDLAQAQGEYQQADLIQALYADIPFATFAPVTFLSALTGRHLNALMPLVMKTVDNLDRRIPTAQLNAVIRDACLTHPAPAKSGKVFRIFYCAQVTAHPPLFIFHCNDPDLATFAYKRFMENTLRANFDFTGVPLTLDFRERARESKGAS